MTDNRAKVFAQTQIGLFRDRLLAARRAILGEIEAVGDDLRTIEETRELELEERSQEESAADVLARIGEREFAELREIEGALHRIVQGTYGVCAHCSKAIASDRLRAKPSALLCSQCAESREERRAPAAQLDENEGKLAPPARAMPPELTALSDAEIARLVRERLGEEVGEALDGVRVACRRGVVTLGGDVASEELRQIAGRIVEDEIGLETVDRLRVSGAGAETRKRRRRPPASPTEELVDAAVAGDEGSEDIFEVEEDGLNYTPPVRPVAETA